jgi:hypothetical protein
MITLNDYEQNELVELYNEVRVEMIKRGLM